MHGAGDMTQRLKALAAFAENPGLVLHTCMEQYTMPVPPVPGSPMPFSDLHQHTHGSQTYIQTLIHTQKVKSLFKDPMAIKITNPNKKMKKIFLSCQVTTYKIFLKVAF